MIVKKAVPGEWGIGSLSDAMLQHTKLPLLVVQADAVRTLGRIHLRPDHDGGASISPRSEEQVQTVPLNICYSPPFSPQISRMLSTWRQGVDVELGHNNL